MKRRSTGVKLCFAVDRRGAEIYPDKGTTADMSADSRIFLGWIDFREADWVKWRCSSKAEWADVAVGLNAEQERLC